MARKPQSEADQFWALADEYLTVSSDPDATFQEREHARDLYAAAVHNAQQAEADGR